MIKSLVILPENVGFKLIAEGIETEVELNILIKLGIDTGQGFFIQRPESKLFDVSKEIKERGISKFFTEDDKSNGFIRSRDREGNNAVFPIASIAIAGIYGCFCDFSYSLEISKFITDIKKEVKKERKSCCIIKNIYAL